MEEAKKEKENRRKKKEDLTAVLEEWAIEEEKEKKCNKGLQEKWEKAIEKWESSTTEAKDAGVKLKDWMKDHPKPKCQDPEFAAEKPLPKPKMRKFDKGEAEEEEDEALQWTDDEQ